MTRTITDAMHIARNATAFPICTAQDAWEQLKEARGQRVHHDRLDRLMRDIARQHKPRAGGMSPDALARVHARINGNDGDAA